jgi:hypothetical protein
MPNIIKLTPEKKRHFLSLLRAGNTITGSCEALGVSYWTVRSHRKRDQRFDGKVRAALDCAVAMVEDALYTEAVKGNVTAIIFFLVNRTKFKKPDEKWQHVQHVRHGGDAEAPPIRTENQTQIDWSKATVDELRQIRAVQERLLTHSSQGNGYHPGGANGSAPAAR